MIEALSGWLGLVLVLAAGLLAVLSDAVRQRVDRSGAAPASGTASRGPASRGWLRRLVLATFVLAALSAAATVVRFASYT